MSIHKSHRAAEVACCQMLSGFSGHRYLLFVALVVEGTMLVCALA